MKGEYEQEVPIYSAKKRMGKHLYDYAREGIEIEEVKNKVRIYDIKLMSFISDEFCIKIRCSSGTYIRSVANDLGIRLGCGAVLSKLNRTKIGKFDLKDSIIPEKLISFFYSSDYYFKSNEILNLKYFIPIRLLAERKKTIYVYKKYQKMLESSYPLYGYMINLNKTNGKNIKENDILSVKCQGSIKYYLHKALTDFNTIDAVKSEQKLTKFIFEEDTI